MVDLNRNILSINFATANVAAYTIGTTSGNPLLLSSGGSIQIFGANPPETINAPLVLEGANGTYAFSSNAASAIDVLNFGGNITGGAAGATVLTLDGGNTGRNIISGIIGNGAATTLAITKNFIGTWVLSGANTYTGGTIINFGGGDGALSIASTGALPGWDTNGRYSVNNGGTLAVYNAVTDANIATMLGTTNFAAGSALGFDTTSGDRTYSAVLTDTAQGALGLTKVGANTLTLSGANTYTGRTNIIGGVLKITAATNLGDSSAPSNTIFIDNGTLESTANTYSLGINRAITLNGPGTVQSDAGTLTVDGNVTNYGNLLTVTGAGNTTINGAITGLGAGSLTKNGTGTLTLSAANNYPGGTNLNAGTLNINNNSALGAGRFTIGGSPAAVTIDNTSGGRIGNANNNPININNNFTFTGSNQLDLGFGAVTLGGNETITVTANNLLIGSIIGDGGNNFGFTKAGGGTLILGSANTYTGATIISGGILKLEAPNAIPATSAVTVATGATLSSTGADDTIGSLAGSGTVTNGWVAPITLTVGGNNTSTSFSGLIEDGLGPVALVKEGTGIFTLSGPQTYTGPTIINAGTLAIGGTSTINGNMVHNAGTLDLGSSTLTLNGNYLQTAPVTLKTTITAAGVGNIAGFGTMATDGGIGSNLIVNIDVPRGTNIPVGTKRNILDGAVGGAVVVPLTVTSSNPSRGTFAVAATDGVGGVGTDAMTLEVLTWTVSNTYAQAATSGNSAAVGAALDAITNPTGDMLGVLNTLDNLSDSQIASSLNTMVPEVDAGVLNTTTTVLNNFVGVSMDRVEKVLTLAKNVDSTSTGMSAGDAGKLTGVWAKGYGSYLTQGTRKGISGYEAWNAGTALGVDRLFSDIVTLGISGGWAYGNVDSDINNGHTYINSAQTTVYGGYSDQNLPYFVDMAGVFAYNWYNGRRDISVVGLPIRRANSEYGGQQYGAYLGGGYKFDVTKNIEFTPLLSLQYNHLELNSYTEQGAGALDLSVGSQGYDQLQSGVGARIASPMKYKWGTLTPEVHGKWLYDFIGDSMVVASTFTGGGPSFNANGAKPALNSFNAGGQLEFDFKNDVSIIGVCDTEMKDEFFGIYGSLTLRYDF